MRRIILLLLAFLHFSLQGYTQIQADNLREYIEQARVEWDVPGMAVAVVKNNELIFSEGFRTLEQGSNKKVDGGTLFAIASNTKAFTSTALAQLVEKKAISWNDKVQKYLPEFKVYDPYVSAHFTIKDLLCHRSGLGTFSGDVIWYKSLYTPQDLLDKLAYVPQDYEFRAGYGYSNLMFITAGLLIEKVSGMSWKNYVQYNILKPLEMKRTQLSTTDLKDNYASPHKIVEGKNTAIEWVNWDNMGAAGGIISSGDDMANWLMTNLNSGEFKGKEVFASAQQEVLWTVANPFKVSEKSKKRVPGRNFNGAALGWFISDYYGNRLISHGGGYDGMYSKVALVPELDLGIVILTNTMKGIATPLTYHIINQEIKKDMRDWSTEYLLKSGAESGMAKRIRKAKEARVLDTAPGLEIGNYCGEYEAEMFGKMKIIEDLGQLKLQFPEAPDLNATLSHWHFDSFEIHWDQTHAWFDFGTVNFKINQNREVEGLSFFVPNNDIFFHELEVRKLK